MVKDKELFKGELPPPPLVKMANPSTKLLAERFELYRAFLGMKGYDFAKYIGISQGTYSDIKNGKNLPGYRTTCNIINLGECDIVWLLTGKK